MKIKLFAAAILFTGGYVFGTFAQVKSIEGEVRECGTNKPIPSAKIEIRSTDSKLITKGQADEKGEFSLTGLQDGVSYKIVVLADGFVPRTYDGFKPGQPMPSIRLSEEFKAAKSTDSDGVGRGKMAVLIFALIGTMVALGIDLHNKIKQESDASKRKRIWIIPASLLILAIGSFGAAYWDAQDDDQEKKELRGNLTTAETSLKRAMCSNTELVATRVQEISAAVEGVNRAIKNAEKTSTNLLTKLEEETKKYNDQISAAVKTSNNNISQLKTATNEAIAVSNSIHGNVWALNSALDNAQAKIDAVNSAVNSSPFIIQQGVWDAVNNSQNLITQTTQNAIKEQTQHIARDVATEVAQIPFTAEQRVMNRRLPGALSDLFITVGDVSRHKPFTVKITNKEVYNFPVDPEKGCPAFDTHCNFDTHSKIDPIVASLCIDLKFTQDRKKIEGKQKKESHSYKLDEFKHNGETYQVEIFAVLQSSWFGKVQDYLIVRIVRPPKKQEQRTAAK